MRVMKDSGVSWLGEVPFDWEVVKIKHPLKERKENNKPQKTDNVLSLLKDKGVIPYDEKGDIGNKSKENLEDYKLAYPGDIVLNSMNVIIGSVGISKYFGAVSPVYYMLNTRYAEDSIEYLNYIFQSEEFQKSLVGYGNGILAHRMRIQMQKLNTVMIPYPNPATQQKIVSYLDIKVAYIDNIIEKTKQSIEEYKKYKQSLITEVVTKGLDKNVKMKDSGIEWIGEIPEHWEKDKIIRLTYVKGRIGWQGLKASEFIEHGPYLITGTDFSNGKVNWDSCAHITEDRYEEANLIQVQEGDLLITKDGTIGKLAIVSDLHDKTSVNSGIFVTRPLDGRYMNKFLYYIMLSEVFWKYFQLSLTGNSTILHLYQNVFEQFWLPLPSINEQEKVVRFLDIKTDEIDTTIKKKEQLILELESYKKSLIYEVVTGKKEIN